MLLFFQNPQPTGIGNDVSYDQYEGHDYRSAQYDLDDYNDEDLSQVAALERAQFILNRKEEEMDWMDQHKKEPLKTQDDVMKNFSGKVVQFDELDFGKKIGEGGFGEVFFAKWHKTVVAVKKLRASRISKRREKQFSEEVLNFCQLDHPNIIKFLGIVLEKSNLCIIMEYMQTSLFNVLFIEEEDDSLSEIQQLTIIQGMCFGLRYLHEKKIAHCDIKSENVLLDIIQNESYVAKISDFGLSMVRTNTETSSAAEVERIRIVGTPRYSAPEVLRGEMLSASDMMMSDIYSLALVIYEVVYREEPFFDLSYAQLQKQVGEKGRLPDMEDNLVQMSIKDTMMIALSFKPTCRPSANTIHDQFLDIEKLFVEDDSPEEEDSAEEEDSPKEDDYDTDESL